MWNSFLAVVEHVSNITGILALCVSVIIWFKLRKQNKLIRDSYKSIPKFENFEETRKYHENVNSINPVALCMSLVPTSNSIKNDVEEFLKSKGKSFENMPIEEYNIPGLLPEKMEPFLNELREVRAKMEAMNATEIHLFIQGPVQAASLIGATFDNWKPVKLYQMNQQTRRYEYWCHLIK